MLAARGLRQSSRCLHRQNPDARAHAAPCPEPNALAGGSSSKTRTGATARVPERKDHDFARRHPVVNVVPDARQEEAAQGRISAFGWLGGPPPVKGGEETGFLEIDAEGGPGGRAGVRP